MYFHSIMQQLSLENKQQWSQSEGKTYEGGGEELLHYSDIIKY